MENSGDEVKVTNRGEGTPIEEVAPAGSLPVPKPLELADGSGGQAAPEPKPTTAVADTSKSTQRKLYLLGFMPQGEIGGLVLGELAEQGGVDRLRTLWLPRVLAANQLRQFDEQIIDDARMADVVREIDPALHPRVSEIEARLQKVPFWRANQHTVAFVRLDNLIVLQNCVNLDRADRLSRRISRDANPEQLLDYAIDFDREPMPIHHRWIGNNTLLFTSDSHDVRPGQLEVRTIPRYSAADAHNAEVPALVVPMHEGEPFIYCVRTFAHAQLPDGRQTRVWFLTLQNGIHRAYALRAMGFEYMPMLIIDPQSSDETNLLMNNWSQERVQQGVSPRPPLLRDFFNPDLTEAFDVRRSTLCVRVSVSIEKFQA